MMQEGLAILVAGAAILLGGAGLVRGCLGGPTDRSGVVLQRWLAVVVGVGAWAVSHACSLFWFDGHAVGLWIKDGVLALLGYAVWRRSPCAAPVHGRRAEDESPAATGLRWVLWAAVVLACTFFVLRSRLSPDGQWDAWMIWNLRARFLMVDGPGWVNGFSPLLHKSHPDYPFLLPSLVAQGWRLFGTSPWVPLAWGGVFAALAVGVLGSAVRLLRGPRSGGAAALLLLGTPCLVTRSANQLADLPVAVFVVASAGLLAAVLSGAVRPRGGLVLAGVCASFAAWTKNEGALHLLVLGLAVAAVGPGEPRRRFQASIWFGLGALPVLAVLITFKLGYAPVNDLVGNTSPAGVGERLASLDRYVTILSSYGQALLSVDKWGGMGFLALALWGLFLPPLRGRVTAPLGLALGLLAAGFSLVYLLTPWDLHWHLATSLHRILLQCWPLALLTVFVALPAIPAPTPAAEIRKAP